MTTKPKRTHSEETEMRVLLVALTDHVLELKENLRKDNLVIGARLDDLESEAKKLSKAHAETRASLESKIDAVSVFAADILKKTNDLHFKLIGSANTLGARLHDLEQERRNRGGTTATDRPPRRR